MIERTLRSLAIVLSLVVAVGFGLFALDEMSRVSTKQTDELAGFERAAPSAAGERQRERRNSTGREYIDDANDVLLAPFAGIADGASRWVQRAVPTFLALLVYGFLLAYVARFTRGRGSSLSVRLTNTAAAAPPQARGFGRRRG